MLRHGDAYGIALKLTGEAADFGGVEGLTKFIAESTAFFSKGDENWFGVVVNKLEVASGGLKLEVEQVVGIV